LAALLHDIGKPYCLHKDGNFYQHPMEGAMLAENVLKRLKASKKQLERIPALIQWHMYDMDCKTSENKLRRFFVQHFEILEDLLLLKQADFSACMDDTSKAPTCQKWEQLLEKMHQEKVPFTLKDLAVSGLDMLEIGIPKLIISETLNKLLMHTAVQPNDNTKERLCQLSLAFLKERNRC
jgi:hypothetical protein